jgi:thiol-disulfide isomerase/thioredoxin
MKNIYLAIAVAALFACNASRRAAHKQDYTVTTEADGTKILNGYINRSLIENDTAFAWFKNNMKYGTADAVAINAFEKNKTKFSMIVFGGTWCSDTQNLLPVFYRLVDKSGYPDTKITLIGVDRAKTTIDSLQKKWSITNVPTFIVMHDGKEVGRIVEYGKYSQIDKELGEIVNSIK